MIKGIGVDAVKISRVEKLLSRPEFKTRIFTQKEIENEHGNIAEYYATRFACKEAVFKALGRKMDLRLIETLNREDGSPYCTIKDEGIVHISITTEADLAIAYCVIEKDIIQR